MTSHAIQASGDDRPTSPCLIDTVHCGSRYWQLFGQPHGHLAAQIYHHVGLRWFRKMGENANR